MTSGRALKFFSLTTTAVSWALHPLVSLVDKASARWQAIGGRLGVLEVTAAHVENGRVLIYLHGGGHWFGSPWTHRELAGRISAASKARVLLLRYSLIPDNPFPAALNDALCCYRWAQKQYPHCSIAVAGDSAGGNLAFALLVKLAQLREKPPVACVGMSPWLLLDPEARDSRWHAERDLAGLPPKSPPQSVQVPDAWTSMYAAGHATADSLISPLLAPLEVVRRFPPILIHCDEDEPLARDARGMAALCEQAGTACELKLFKNTMHVHQGYPLFFRKEARESLEHIGAFLERHWMSAGELHALSRL